MTEDRLLSARPKPIDLSPVVTTPKSFAPLRHVPPRLLLEGWSRHDGARRPRRERNRPFFSRWTRAVRRL